MSVLVDFVVRLLTDLIVMPQIFIEDIFLSDPLSAIIIIFGSLFIGVASAVLGYAVLGALGVPLPRLGRGADNRVE